MKHHVRGCLEVSSADTVILHFRTNKMKSDKAEEYVAIDIMHLAICVKKKVVVASSLMLRTSLLNSLLKRKCDEQRINFGYNSNITASMLDYSGLHLNVRGTTRLANNLCSSYAK